MGITSTSEFIHFYEYHEFVRSTDQSLVKGSAGIHLPLLGLFGEVGSLLSELKKRQRDADSYAGYEEHVIEELGDVIWYFTNVADRAGLNINILAQRIFREIDDWDIVEDYKSGTFGDIDPSNPNKGVPANSEEFERCLMVLAGEVGKLLSSAAENKIFANRDILSAHMVNIFKAIFQAIEVSNISLEDAVRKNIEKISSRWPEDPQYPNLFDCEYVPDEQLPRVIEMEIEEVVVHQEKYFVVQKCNGIKIGDRLTDNKTEEDDYRFHDVFHLAYAAILGWSPVIRAQFKVKRKSNPKVDENQDGARALLIEEGVVTWVFNHGFRLKFYENITSVDYSLLKSIQEFVKGYEVDKCPLWLWEKAILEGFKLFRFLKVHRKGKIIANLNTRSISIEPLAD